MTTPTQTQRNIKITDRPLFSILHTSARPDQWEKVYHAWMNNCVNPSAVEYVLCIDDRWGFTPEIMRTIQSKLRPQDRVTLNKGRKCYVDGVNSAAAASTGVILIVNADDQYPCVNWDAELIKLVPQSSDFVIQVGTGTTDEFSRGIMVMPILSRPRYEKQNYVFYPAYESMYADNDFYESAVFDKVLVNGSHLLFPHRHPLMDRTVAVDEPYRYQNREEAYSIGRKILDRRRANGFGRVREQVRPTVMETPSVYSQFQTQTQRKTIGVGLPGETFSSAWVTGWTELFGSMLNQFGGVYPLLCYSSNVYATRSTIYNHFADSRPRPDYILWLDDDNILTTAQLTMLIQDLDARPDVDIVTGWCWIAADVYDNGVSKTSVGMFDAFTMMTRHLPYAELMAGTDPLREIEFTGFPVVLMRGAVIDKLPSNPFAPVFNPGYSFGFSGEDTAFCIRVKESGMKILVDRRVKVPHLKLRSAEPKDLPEVIESVA